MRLRELTNEATGLSPATLSSYKRKAGAEASALDKEAFEKGGPDAQAKLSKAHKRYKGINKATQKQFDNDAKGIVEMDSQGYTGSRDSGDPDAGKKEYRGKAVKAKDVAKQGLSHLHKAFDRAVSKEKKASPAQVEKNKTRWAQRQAEKGVAEGTANNIDLLIQKLEDMSELIYQMVPGSKKDRLIDKRDELETRIESMPGGKEALRKWARAYNDSFDEGVAEGLEQVYRVLAVDKSNALSKQVKLKVKASSLDEVFERLAINDWYPLEINGIEVINGKRLKQGVAEAEKKPHPKTWHDVDPKLGKQVDKMSQAEKVKKGFAHPDTLKKKGVAESSEERSQKRLWAQITDYEKRAKATKNDIKRDHYLKMASELRSKLRTTDDVEESQVNEISTKLRDKYVTRASDDYGHANFAARASKSHPGLEKYSQEQETRAKKRAAGLNRALSDKRLGRVEESGNNTVSFEVDSERAYNYIMDKFGHAIEWDGDAMVIPSKYWGAVQELAYAAGGEATEYNTVDEASLATMRDYFAGDENAKDEMKITQMRKYYANDASKEKTKNFNSLASYHHWLKQVGAEKINRK